MEQEFAIAKLEQEEQGSPFDVEKILDFFHTNGPRRQKREHELG